MWQTRNQLLDYVLYFVITIFCIEYLSSMVNARTIHVIDAVGYYLFSKVPFFTTDFWMGMRPVGYPLFIKLLDSNPNLVITIQSLFFLFSWSFFVFYLYKRAYNKFFGLLCAIGILVIVIHPSIAVWTHHVLTESLTITMIAWIYLLLYEYIISKSKKYLYFLVLILVYYSTIRDVNAYYVLSFLMIFAVLLFFKRIKKLQFIAIGIFLILSFLFSNYTADHARNTITGKELTFESNGKTIAARWMLPFFDVMGRRILADPSAFEYMKKHGMPVNSALLKQNNKWGVNGWYDNPELQGFRDWATKEGKATYTKFLISHPIYTFGQLYTNRHKVFHYHQKEATWYKKEYLKGYRPDNIFLYSDITNEIIYRVLLVSLVFTVLLLLLIRKTIFTLQSIIIILLFIPILLLAIITYHGDSGDVFRHTIVIPAFLKISLLMLIYVLGNNLFNPDQKVK